MGLRLKSNGGSVHICSIRDLDDIAALTANIDKLSVAKGFVGNHPGPANRALASNTLQINFYLLYLGVHTGIILRFACSYVSVERLGKKDLVALACAEVSQQ